MYMFDSFIMDLPGACVDDITPPTFAGIASLSAQNGGEVLPGWLIATDSESGVHGYNIYIGLGVLNAASLFVSSNLAFMAEHPDLQARVYRLRNGTRLLENQIYTVGVRAIDNSGNESSNIELLTVTSLGVLDDTAANLARVATLALLAGSSCDLAGTIEDANELKAEIEDC